MKAGRPKKLRVSKSFRNKFRKAASRNPKQLSAKLARKRVRRRVRR